MWSVNTQLIGYVVLMLCYHRYNMTVPALKGCVKIGTAGGSTPSVQEKVGVGRGCTNELQVIKFIFHYSLGFFNIHRKRKALNHHALLQIVRKAEFSLGSSLEKLHEDFSLDDVSLSLGFRSTKPDGILLQNSKNVCIHSYIHYMLKCMHMFYSH